IERVIRGFSVGARTPEKLTGLRFHRLTAMRGPLIERSGVIGAPVKRPLGLPDAIGSVVGGDLLTDEALTQRDGLRALADDAIRASPRRSSPRESDVTASKLHEHVGNGGRHPH